MCMVVPRDQSSFALGSVQRAERLFPAEKSCALDAPRYLAFSLLFYKLLRAETVPVRECVCVHIPHFAQ